MIALTDILQQHRSCFVARYHSQLLPGHHRALQALTDCRSGVYGETLWQCDQCNDTVRVPLCCSHRSCPRCQHHETTVWLRRQTDKLLPVNYFLLTFTLPAQLRSVAWRYQRLVFDCLFKAVSQTLKQFAAQFEHLGGQAGMT